jgi:hypothetical protein
VVEEVGEQTGFMNDAWIAVYVRGVCGDDLLNVLESLWGHDLPLTRHDTTSLDTHGNFCAKITPFPSPECHVQCHDKGTQVCHVP